MEIKDLNIHDSQIISVIEDTEHDTLDFVIIYPVDYNNYVYSKKILRFYDVLNYTINEMPFGSQPCFLDFVDYGQIEYEIGEGRSKMEIIRKKIRFSTNAGWRTLEYNSLDLLDTNEID